MLSADAADKAYADQVSRQVARITAELNMLDQLLTAGMVDRRVLLEFRDSVNRVRSTSWNVMNWMEALNGKNANLASLLLQERVRIAKQVSLQLSSDLIDTCEHPTSAEMTELKQAVAMLHWTLINLAAPEEGAGTARPGSTLPQARHS